MTGRIAALFAALAAASGAAFGQSVVTVTPENPQGWSIEANAGGYGALAAFGPALNESADGFKTPTGLDLGRGAFYASCGYAGQSGSEYDKTPSTVWLGLDRHNGRSLAGIALNRITSLRYWSFVSKIPTRHGGNPSLWDSWTWWRYPKQPVTVTLTIERADGSDRRQLWYRPWGATVKGDDLNEKAIGKWQYFNCLTQGRWLLLLPDYDGNPSLSFENWNQVLTAYGSYRLVATSDVPWSQGGWKSPGWKGSTIPTGNPRCTGTGKALNLMVGARFYTFRWPGESTSTAWWPESVGFRGHVDHFSLGIDGVEVTYNFEPGHNDPGPDLLYTSQRSLTHPIFQLPAVQQDHRFKISGRVVERANPYFSIDDGTGLSMPTQVYWMNNTAAVGQYWEVWGFIERPRFTTVSSPFIVWTDPGHCRRVQ